MLFLTTVLSGGCGFIYIYIERERELSVFVEYEHNDQTRKAPPRYCLPGSFSLNYC